jgi:hypothetical protein
MQRESLVHARGGSITADAAEALRQLEVRCAERGNLRLLVQTVPLGGADDLKWKERFSEWSMKHTGRWLDLDLAFDEPEVDEGAEKAHRLAVLWALAIPCGFTPMQRYPIPTEDSRTFHCLGPWQILYDHLMGEGRGEEAWPSMCAAAQCDVGTWKGDRVTERFVQAQLHRVGVNVGPIDGQLAHRSLTGLKRLGLDSMPLTDAATRLAGMGSDQPKPQDRRIGHVVVPGQNLTIVCTGQVYSTKTATGAALTIDGPGRAVLDLTPKG